MISAPLINQQAQEAMQRQFILDRMANIIETLRRKVERLEGKVSRIEDRERGAVVEQK